MFQLTAARRRLVNIGRHAFVGSSFNSQPPEGGWIRNGVYQVRFNGFQLTAARRRLATKRAKISTSSSCFNSQPPEGGWLFSRSGRRFPTLFQLTAARRRLEIPPRMDGVKWLFQLTAARRRLVKSFEGVDIVWVVSTHSRPKAAGALPRQKVMFSVFQLTAARRRLADKRVGMVPCHEFQLTAARRRLGASFL